MGRPIVIQCGYTGRVLIEPTVLSDSPLSFEDRFLIALAGERDNLRISLRATIQRAEKAEEAEEEELKLCRVILDGAECHQVGIHNGIHGLIAQVRSKESALAAVRKALEEARPLLEHGFQEISADVYSPALQRVYDSFEALDHLEAALATAREEARINLESASAESIDRDAMFSRAQKAETELSDLKVELARAREEELNARVRVQYWVLANLHNLESMSTLEVSEAIYHAFDTPAPGELRAALVPEQKRDSER